MFRTSGGSGLDTSDKKKSWTRSSTSALLRSFCRITVRIYSPCSRKTLAASSTLYPHSSSTDSDRDKKYSSFAIYAYLRHMSQQDQLIVNYTPDYTDTGMSNKGILWQYPYSAPQSAIYLFILVVVPGRRKGKLVVFGWKSAKNQIFSSTFLLPDTPIRLREQAKSPVRGAIKAGTKTAYAD